MAGRETLEGPVVSGFAPLLISVEQAGSVQVIGVSGEVDLATAPALATALRGPAADGADLVVDLSRTSFLDCRGVHLLIEAGTAQRDAGHGFAIACPETGEVARVLSLIGAAGAYLPLHRSRAAAIAAARRPSEPGVALA